MSEVDYKKAEKEHVDMTTLVMQGNAKAVQDVMSYLAYASDTSDTSWLTRLEKSGGIDGLLNKYEKAYQSLSESKLNSVMAVDFDEKAKRLADQLEDLKEAVKPYTDSKLKADADEATAKAYFTEHTDYMCCR